MKNETSSKKVEANRRNSVRSTGPRTEQGKRVARSNSIRHGFYSKEAIIKRGDGRESLPEFNRMRDSLLADLRPQGDLQQLVADLIVAHAWRLRRVFRFEAGALRSRLDTVKLDREFRVAEDLRWDLATVADSSSLGEKLRRSSSGIRFLIRLLETAQEELNENGSVSEKIHKWLVISFGAGEGSISAICSSLVYRPSLDDVLADPETNHQPPVPASNEARNKTLNVLTEEIQSLRPCLEDALDREELKSDADIATLYLPQHEVAERIIRFGSMLERQLFNCIAELRRLQREQREN